MRFYAGPKLLMIDELGYLPLPAEGATSQRQGGQGRLRGDAEPGPVLAQGPLAQVTTQPDTLDSTFVADCGGCTGFVDLSGRMFIGTNQYHVYREALQFDLSAIPAG